MYDFNFIAGEAPEYTVALETAASIFKNTFEGTFVRIKSCQVLHIITGPKIVGAPAKGKFVCILFIESNVEKSIKDQAKNPETPPGDAMTVVP
jgi:hypothetical protein